MVEKNPPLLFPKRVQARIHILAILLCRPRGEYFCCSRWRIFTSRYTLYIKRVYLPVAITCRSHVAAAVWYNIDGENNFMISKRKIKWFFVLPIPSKIIYTITVTVMPNLFFFCKLFITSSNGSLNTYIQL